MMKGVIFLFLSVTCVREDCAIVRLGWDVTAWMGTYGDKQGRGSDIVQATINYFDSIKQYHLHSLDWRCDGART